MANKQLIILKKLLTIRAFFRTESVYFPGDRKKILTMLEDCINIINDEGIYLDAFEQKVYDRTKEGK